MKRTALLVALALALPAVAGAQTFDRAERWDFTVTPYYQGSTTLEADDDSKLDTSGELGFALGFGYNLNNHLNLNFTAQWASVDYDSVIYSIDNPGSYAEIEGEYAQWSTFVGADYNFMAGPITPYATGGLGYSWFDTNVPSGLPSTGCWWDPWYGYVCTTTYPTHVVDGFSYKAGLGVRFDVNPRFFVKAGYEMQWHDLDRGTADFGVWKVDLGFFNF